MLKQGEDHPRHRTASFAQRPSGRSAGKVTQRAFGRPMMLHEIAPAGIISTTTMTAIRMGRIRRAARDHSKRWEPARLSPCVPPPPNIANAEDKEASHRIPHGRSYQPWRAVLGNSIPNQHASSPAQRQRYPRADLSVQPA